MMELLKKMGEEDKEEEEECNKELNAAADSLMQHYNDCKKQNHMYVVVCVCVCVCVCRCFCKFKPLFYQWFQCLSHETQTTLIHLNTLTTYR